MKEVFYFLQWQWRRFETWQRIYLFAMFLIGAGLTASNPIKSYLMGSGIVILAGFFLKWIFWDSTKNAWKAYQKEKQQVVDIMSGHEK
jgi:hypothetical protein